MAVRSLVSKKKVRYTDEAEGFDLDLTYVTKRVIAMGAPSMGLEGVYRNPLPEVQRFFETRHAGKYKIYDLRAEKGAMYDPSLFATGVVTGFRFYDHSPPPFKLVRACCEDMAAWLRGDPERVVAVHCKAGKGRTGLMIACYLLLSGAAKSADEALKQFGDARTHDGKGVTIPSQIRYVRYFAQSLLRSDVAAAPPTLRLTAVHMNAPPNFDPGGGCDPYFQVRVGEGGKGKLVFDYKQATKSKLKHFKAGAVDLDVAPFNVRVKGDVKLSFFDFDRISEDDKMFHLWLHTAFVPPGGRLTLRKAELDRACKDKGCKEFPADFAVELTLEPAPEGEGEGQEGGDAAGRLRSGSGGRGTGGGGVGTGAKRSTMSSLFGAAPAPAGGASAHAPAPGDDEDEEEEEEDDDEDEEDDE